MMKSLKILINLGLLALVLIVWQSRSYLSTPIGGNLTVTLEVSSGDTLRLVLHKLADKKFLSYPDLLYSYARLANKTTIRTGSYEFFPTQTPLGLLRDLEEGRVETERLTIVEGWNRWQIRDALAKEGWLDSAKFDALCDDLPFLESNQIPGPTCEGYLFPETYEFARGVSAKRLSFVIFLEHINPQFKRLPMENTVLCSLVSANLLPWLRLLKRKPVRQLSALE